ncbi:ester cyclase [Sandarakinorhabdus sp. DWP1-3-1]|uniref:nuclear transport factor 2 family protein n=1 Tax=Sandarakinorhabdus sp. DWP1-3-1 TaxID=2804627 RepID=UPI003CEC4050
MPPSETSTDPHGIFAADALEWLAPDHRLNAFHPVEGGNGAGVVANQLLAPLAAALPGFEVRADIAMRGIFRGGLWTATSGHLFGRFLAPLFGIPPTGRIAHVRFGCFQNWQDGKAIETIVLIDLPALMMQAGAWPLGPPLGPLLMAPGPIGGGIWPTATDESGASLALESAASLALVEAMIGGLMRFDGQGLATMGMTAYWRDDFWWFGPGPIGSFRGHADYERGHQLPFLTAFPDRVGGNHRARFGDGHFVASTGWPSITATHRGGGWLGLAPTDRAITMRVMDFWRRDGDRLAENWVMIDISELLSQMGIDLFARMAALNDRS